MSFDSSHLKQRFVNAEPMFGCDADDLSEWDVSEPVKDFPLEEEDEVEEESLEESFFYVEGDTKDDSVSFHADHNSHTASDANASTATTYRSDSGQVLDEVPDFEHDSVKGYVLADQKREAYRKRYDKEQSTWGGEYCTAERFAELCEATEGWTRDELGELIVEGNVSRDLEALGCTSENVSAEEYAYNVRGLLQGQRDWFRGTLLPEDAIRYFMPFGFAYTRSDAFKTISQRHEQVGSGRQESQVDRC